MYSQKVNLTDNIVFQNDSYPLVSVNWHFWSYCNYNCKFCFAKSLKNIPPVSKQKALVVPSKLVEVGTEKITLTGGEPFLCSYLPEIVQATKDSGLITMIVTNGSVIRQPVFERIADNLDWIGLSLDSTYESINQRLGRGTGNHNESILGVVQQAKELGIKVKINTVINSLNWTNDFFPMLDIIKPDRWKVFQMTKVLGENDSVYPSLRIDKKKFYSFVDRHGSYTPIVETENLMRGSYIMLDPQCRFFQNTSGKLVFSKSIFESKTLFAHTEVGWDFHKFMDRGGVYHW